MFDTFPGLPANLLLAGSLLLLLRNISNQSRWLRCIFAGFAILINFRYFLWRLHATMDPFLSSLESVWHWAFFSAELIAISSLSWHLFVLMWPPKKPLKYEFNKLDPSLQDASVDVCIPTFNETQALLINTIEAAEKIDYPNFKIHVLDDGGREWLRTLCQKKDIHYIARGRKKDFKAGNLNHALSTCEGDYLLCIDADFTVYPDIIKKLIGYFSDSQVAIVQSPQHFRNSDAIQYNLRGENSWPEEQEVFSDIMQPCRDNWDNSFCYGTNFIIRRTHLDQINGFPTASVCEDILLTYTLKKHGWITRYHNEELALGEASNTLSSFISQRSRWCAGTIQCLLTKDGPIRSNRLSFMDRLFFMDPAFYYMSSVWFFFILIAPAIFWWTGYAPFHADNGHLLMMLAPRVLVSMIVLYWLTNRKVLPIISEIGRYVSIFHILQALVTTLLKPRSPRFGVTDKSNSRQTTSFNWHIARPHCLILFITCAGIARTTYLGLVTENGLNENIGLILALTVFSFWVIFIALLSCIEPALTMEQTATRTKTGNFRRSLRSITLKVFES